MFYVWMSKQCGGIINRNFQVTVRAYTRLTEPVVSLLARRQVTLRTNFNLIHLQLNKQKMYRFKFKQMKIEVLQIFWIKLHTHLMLTYFHYHFSSCCEFVIAWKKDMHVNLNTY